MKQVFCKANYDVGFGGSVLYTPPMGGTNWNNTTAEASVPWSTPGTFKNLVIQIPVPQITSQQFRLVVNGALTNLTCNIPPMFAVVSNVVDFVTVAPGDVISLRWSGTSGAGFPFNYSLEFDSTTDFLSGYTISGGVSRFAGFPSQAGMLGNGTWADYAGGNVSTYSMAGCAGSVKRLDVLSSSQTPGSSIYVLNLVKNTILQDGTGGTVDTTTTLTGTSTTASKLFTLHVEPKDVVEVRFQVTGSTVASQPRIGCSIAFQSDIARQFHIAGGNNNSSSQYWWNTAPQGLTDENIAATPIGPTGFGVVAMYTKRSPSGGASWTDTLRLDGTNTGVFAVADGSGVGEGFGTMTALPDHYLDIGTVSSFSSSQFHWAFTGVAVEEITPGLACIPTVPIG